MNKVILKLSLAIIVGILSQYIEFAKNDILKGVSIFLIATVFLFFDIISEFILEIKNKRKIKKEMLRASEKINIFIKKYIKGDIDENIVQELMEYQKIEDLDFIENIFKKVLEYNNDEVERIYSIFICYKIDNEKNRYKIGRYKEYLDDLLMQEFKVNEKLKLNKNLLNFYHNYKNNKKLMESLDIEDYNEIQKEFLNKYSVSSKHIMMLSLEKEQAEEFRKTLSRMHLSGKINLKLLDREAKKRIKEHLNRDNSQSVLFFCRGIEKNKSIYDYLDDFDGIKIGKKSKQGKTEHEVMFLHMRIIIFPEGFTYKDFYDGLKRKIEKEKISGFFAIHPLGKDNFLLYPKNESEIEDDNYKKSYNLIKKLKKPLIENYEKYLGGISNLDMTLEEISAIIPFNIFVPKINEKAKNMIIDHYESLREKFQIKTLSDWSDINDIELGDFLNKIDSKEDIYSHNYWRKISKIIIDKSIIHRNALHGIK